MMNPCTMWVPVASSSSCESNLCFKSQYRRVQMFERDTYLQIFTHIFHRDLIIYSSRSDFELKASEWKRQGYVQEGLLANKIMLLPVDASWHIFLVLFVISLEASFLCSGFWWSSRWSWRCCRCGCCSCCSPSSNCWRWIVVTSPSHPPSMPSVVSLVAAPSWILCWVPLHRLLPWASNIS